jgi:hypothetical protein
MRSYQQKERILSASNCDAFLRRSALSTMFTHVISAEKLEFGSFPPSHMSGSWPKVSTRSITRTDTVMRPFGAFRAKFLSQMFCMSNPSFFLFKGILFRYVTFRLPKRRMTLTLKSKSPVMFRSLYDSKSYSRIFDQIGSQGDMICIDVAVYLYSARKASNNGVPHISPSNHSRSQDPA